MASLVNSKWTENYFSHSVVLSSLPDTCMCQWCGGTGHYDHTCIAPYNLGRTNLPHMLRGLEYKCMLLIGTFIIFLIEEVSKDLPLSQRGPIQPAGHEHLPLCLSHTPPFSHSHSCWQSMPKCPGAHSGNKTHKDTHRILYLKHMNW